MENSSRRRIPDEEINQMFDEILEEDEQENEDEDSSESCSGECAQEDPVVQKKFCECVRLAENSSRFSLRVMEAMRWLQKHKDKFLPTSSAEDIVGYIRRNYRDVGDLYAQVRTALKQVCSQGFVLELLENEYHLIGPDAASMNQNISSSCPKNSSSPLPAKAPKRCKRNTSQDVCTCERPSYAEPGRNTKRHRQVSKNGTRPSNMRREQNISAISLNERIRGNTNEEVNESRRRSIQEPLMDTLRTRGTNNGRRMSTGDAGNDRVTEDVEEVHEDDFEVDNVEDHEESRNQIRLRRKRQKEKELERWIERCRKECERRRNRQSRNN